MSNKLVWSSSMTQDYLLNLPAKHLRFELVDYGYDEEMLAKFSDEELRELVAQDADDVFWPMDSDEFEQEIVPMISSQTKDGIVLMSGTAGTWRGNFKSGKAVYADGLAGGDICSDCYEIRIDDVDGSLVWSGCHHDGCHHMGLYALPEDELKLRDFVDACMDGAVDLELRYGEDISRDEAIEIVKQALDINYINDYCDFSKVPEVCEPIRNTANIAVGEELEEPVEEACVNEELPEVEEPVEAPKKSAKRDLEALANEFEDLEADFEDFGPDGFYAVPFDSFKREFPEFTKDILMSWLTKMELETPEDLEDPEYIEDLWANGELIQPDDWNALFDGVRIMLKGANVQWDKIWKKYYRSLDKY